MFNIMIKIIKLKTHRKKIKCENNSDINNIIYIFIYILEMLINPDVIKLKFKSIKTSNKK